MIEHVAKFTRERGACMIYIPPGKFDAEMYKPCLLGNDIF